MRNFVNDKPQYSPEAFYNLSLKLESLSLRDCPAPRQSPSEDRPRRCCPQTGVPACEETRFPGREGRREQVSWPGTTDARPPDGVASRLHPAGRNREGASAVSRTLRARRR